MAEQVKVRERGFGLLRPRLNVGSALSVTIVPLKASYAQMRRYMSEPYLYLIMRLMTERNILEI